MDSGRFEGCPRRLMWRPCAVAQDRRLAVRTRVSEACITPAASSRVLQRGMRFSLRCPHEVSNCAVREERNP